MTEAEIFSIYNEELPRLSKEAERAQAALESFSEKDWENPEFMVLRDIRDAAREAVTAAEDQIWTAECPSLAVLELKLKIYSETLGNKKAWYAAQPRPQGWTPTPPTSLYGMAELIVRDLRRQWPDFAKAA